MKRVEKYTGEKTYMFPNGQLATKEAVLKHFPAALTFAHVVETDDEGQVMWAFQNLAAMKTMHGIDKSVPEQAAIEKLQQILNAPAPIPGPTPEERMAAAMEFQNMMMIKDEKEDA